MPHDFEGTKLEVGDTVILFARVVSIQEGEEYCNCTIKPLYAMPPYKAEDAFQLSSINTRQLIKEV